MPGMIRASFGCYNNKEDVDRLVSMLDRVARGDYKGSYKLDVASGEHIPTGYQDSFQEHFLLEPVAGY